MCGRFALDDELDELIDSFVIKRNNFPDWAPRWNMPPTTTVPLVVDVISGRQVTRSLGPARWSLTPSWSKTLELDYPTFNARVETAHEKPSFRESVATRRGLIPATAYYEWHNTGQEKTPHAVALPSLDTFALAALYSVWSDGSSSVVTATILTREAPNHLAWLHERTPLALPAEWWSDWLSPHTRGDADLLSVAVEQSEHALRALTVWPVAPLRGEGSTLLEPAV